MVELWLALSLAVVAALVLTFLRPRAIVWLLARLNPGVLYYVPTNLKVVALTIDDAPHSSVTPEILAELEKQRARATFFVIGDRISDNDMVLKDIVQRGNEIGNHDLHDRNSLAVTPDQLEGDLLRVHASLSKYGVVKWFRPGHGRYNPRLVDQAARIGYRTCLGSVYPLDAHLRSTFLVRSLVLAGVFPGAIIVLHDGKAERRGIVKTLRKLLPALRRRGYSVVTLSELVGLSDRGSSA